MAKNRGWFFWLKKFFASEEKQKAEKKSKRHRWVLGRLKCRQCPALPAPLEGTVDEAAEKHRKYALTVALATAAAAEAAVAAAQAAAEVVRLTSASQSNHQFIEEDENLAAMKIQTAFRAYLARKALRALKALVRLQAIARGRAVRRKTGIKLKLPRTKMQSEVVGKKTSSVDNFCKYDEQKKVLKSRKGSEEKQSKGQNYRKDDQLLHLHPEFINQTSWDCSMLSKEGVDGLWLKRQEASIKRERMLKYSLSQKERKDYQMLGSGRHSYQQVEQWTRRESFNKEDEIENLKPIVISNKLADDVSDVAALARARSIQKLDFMDRSDSPVSFPRRSFGRPKWSTPGNESSAPNSPIFPTYMASTQSTMAKARSMSMPKQRIAFKDCYFDRSFSSKNDPCIWSYYNGGLPGTKGKSGASKHISAALNLHY